MKSLSEIETTSKRASKAVGFSWGIAEEVGKGVRLLELFGLEGIKNLNEYFKSKANNQFENLNLINDDNQSDKHPYCPIIFGISFLDQVKTLEKFDKIRLNNIKHNSIVLNPFSSIFLLNSDRNFIDSSDKGRLSLLQIGLIFTPLISSSQRA